MGRTLPRTTREQPKYHQPVPHEITPEDPSDYPCPTPDEGGWYGVARHQQSDYDEGGEMADFRSQAACRLRFYAGIDSSRNGILDGKSPVRCSYLLRARFSWASGHGCLLRETYNDFEMPR